jgi:DNA gyrase subunit A
MNVSRGDNRVLAMDIARDDTELLVVTENGYGKRTAIAEYPVKGRGTMGVKTIAITEKKGGLAGAMIVREHHELVFISQNGMVQRTSVRGISKYGRASQGVRVMNLREDDVVSAVALVMETNTSAQVQDELAEGEEETLAAVGDGADGADGETPEAAVDDADDAEPESDEGDDDAAEGAEPEPGDADE